MPRPGHGLVAACSQAWVGVRVGGHYVPSVAVPKVNDSRRQHKKPRKLALFWEYIMNV